MHLKDLVHFFSLPRASINLMLEKTQQNDPFYAQVVKNFYAEARSRHPKLFFVKRLEFGFTVCQLPREFDTYYMQLEASARRNHRKALRAGYTMKRFDWNSKLEDVREIWTSTPIRQGELPEYIRLGRVEPITHPASRTPYHDYPYFGVFKNEKLVAYAACLISGELCNLNSIIGHHDDMRDGVVPFLIIEIARELLKSFPSVKYFCYGTYFGASDTMRRFKRKFLFKPYRVNWVLGRP